jgi:hypothetical protein
MLLLNGSVIYRSMGALSRTLAASQPPGAVFVVLLTVYSGFVVPFRDMRPWLKWFSYINPVYYAFEAMVINEVMYLVQFLPLLLTVPNSSPDEISTVQSSFQGILVFRQDSSAPVLVLQHNGGPSQAMSTWMPNLGFIKSTCGGS